MPKHKKTSPKKNFISDFLQSSGVTLTAIVLLCVSVGAVIVPGIFAATTLVVTNAKATPTNTAAYGLNVTWNGTTQNGWLVQVYSGGSTMVTSVTTSTGQATINGLTCGTTYTIKIYPRQTNGTPAATNGLTNGTPTCPVASWVSLSGSTNTLYATWNDTYGFSQSYSLTANAPGGIYSSTTTSSKTATLSASCGMTYTVTLKATANGQSGATVSKTTSTAGCPPTPSGGGTTPSGGSTGTTTPPSSGSNNTTPSSGNTGSSSPPASSSPSTKTKTSTSSSGTKKATTAAPVSVAPSTPENFSADVVSSKIVALTWDASTNVDHYVLKRSLDQTSWQDLTSVTTPFYNDISADFSKTYYYQLQAVGSDGKTSDTVTAQATTEAFKGSSNTIMSADKLVKVTIPDGAIDGDYNCTLQASDDGLDPSALSANQSALLGPFDLMCVTADGVVVEEYLEPLQVTMSLASVVSGYDNITVRMAGDDGWQATKANYDAKKKTVSFEMTSAKQFAAFGVKHKSPLGTIISIFFILLLAGAAIAAGLWWRRRAPAHMATMQTQATAEEEFKAALAKPNCTHLGMAQQVMPSGQGCLECEATHTDWNALRICLICGHVGCSDDSPEQHAHKHFMETGHPIVYDYADPNGNSIGWCYIDQTYI